MTNADGGRDTATTGSSGLTVALANPGDSVRDKRGDDSAAGWTGWRGPRRDGRVAWLPQRWATPPRKIWERPLTAKGLGGIAATKDYVLVSDRELSDTTDAFRCLRADSGEEIWRLAHPAPGELDYGNSPRATPLIAGDVAFLFGAFGHLHCVELATGKVRWLLDLHAEFELDDPPRWGSCSSPLLVDGKLVVNPGAGDASLVALDPRSGRVLWKSPGAAAGYGSLIAGTLGGKRQIVGHDTDSLGGWDVADGKRLWRLTPPRPRDFNVPTPLIVDDRLIVCTENNGTRMYRFAGDGQIDPQPLAVNADLAPDTHTPVVIGRRLFGISSGLHCLNLDRELKPDWTNDDGGFYAHASVIASDDRLLITTLDGELLLVDAKADRFQLLGRHAALPGERGIYAHPALVGSRLYLRGNTSIVCVELNPD